MGKEEEKEATSCWGTWEELLLACAVKRHGVKDWDTVAMEVQTKSSLPHLLTTPHNCKIKYQDLLRRFTTPNDTVLHHQNHHNNNINNNNNHNNNNNIPWLDELRKRRVAELKQEVQRYDVSILSLETKVKKLEEERERERRVKDDEKISQEKPDLEEERSENDTKEIPAGKVPVPGEVPREEESDRDNRSFNESNSTGSKTEKEKTVKDAKQELEPVVVRPDPESSGSKPAVEDSGDGSSDTVAKNASVEPSQERKGGDSSELPTNGGARDSSEVQSSASLTRKRKRRRRKEISGGEEPSETLDSAVKSQPFVSLLEIIRAHKTSSLFERRLQIQETDEYKNTVRQHVDLETIESRLHKGLYSTCSFTFYRDLLLLFNNATIFFPKSSLESITAYELLHLVLNEMKKLPPKPNPPPPKVDSPAPIPVVPQPKPELERSDSLLAKQKQTAPIIVCRKRSSMSAKPSSSATFGGQKVEEKSSEKKPALDLKPSVNKPPPSSNIAVEEDGLAKGKEKEKEKEKETEKPITGARSLRRISNKNLTNNTSVTTTPSSSSKKQQSTSSASTKAGLVNKQESPKNNKKKAEKLALEKKRSAADFLKRIKRNSPGETLRSGGGSGSNGGGSGGKEQRKSSHSGSGKDDKRRERVLRQSSEKKEAKEEISPSKRSVGRPPKKAAEVSLKRGRERERERETSTSGGKEVEALKRPRKRSRR